MIRFAYTNSFSVVCNFIPANLKTGNMSTKSLGSDRRRSSLLTRARKSFLRLVVFPTGVLKDMLLVGDVFSQVVLTRHLVALHWINWIGSLCCTTDRVVRGAPVLRFFGVRLELTLKEWQKSVVAGPQQDAAFLKVTTKQKNCCWSKVHSVSYFVRRLPLRHCMPSVSWI